MSRGIVKAHEPMGCYPLAGFFIGVGIEIVEYDIEPLVRSSWFSPRMRSTVAEETSSCLD